MLVEFYLKWRLSLQSNIVKIMKCLCFSISLNRFSTSLSTSVTIYPNALLFLSYCFKNFKVAVKLFTKGIIKDAVLFFYMTNLIIS